MDKKEILNEFQKGVLKGKTCIWCGEKLPHKEFEKEKDIELKQRLIQLWNDKEYDGTQRKYMIYGCLSLELKKRGFTINNILRKKEN